MLRCAKQSGRQNTLGEKNDHHLQFGRCTNASKTKKLVAPSFNPNTCWIHCSFSVFHKTICWCMRKTIVQRFHLLGEKTWRLATSSIAHFLSYEWPTGPPFKWHRTTRFYSCNKRLKCIQFSINRRTRVLRQQRARAWPTNARRLPKARNKYTRFSFHNFAKDSCFPVRVALHVCCVYFDISRYSCQCLLLSFFFKPSL